MNIGNPDIQKYIEMGSKAEMEWKITIKGMAVTLKWSPIKEWEGSSALASGFDIVSDELREWLLGEKKDRKKMEKKGFKPNRDEIRDFNHRYAVSAVFFALKPFYSELTREQIEELDINFIRFHNLIMEASGDKDGRETVQSFPGDE